MKPVEEFVYMAHEKDDVDGSKTMHAPKKCVYGGLSTVFPRMSPSPLPKNKIVHHSQSPEELHGRLRAASRIEFEHDFLWAHEDIPASHVIHEKILAYLASETSQKIHNVCCRTYP